MAKKEADALASASHTHPSARQSVKRTFAIRFASCAWTNTRFSGLQPMSESGLTLCAYLMTAVTKILQVIQKFCAIKSEKAVLTGTDRIDTVRD